MSNSSKEMFDFLSEYLSKSDIYASKAIAKISMFILKSRQDLNMTQKAFAQMMGVTQAMVSKWESAEYNFTIENIAHIAEKLNTTFEIEFTPESEYLVTNNNNNYESTNKNQTWQTNGKIINFGVAA